VTPAARFGILGAAVGTALSLAAAAPAAWLASALGAATGQRLLLAEAQGSVWRGNAVAVLTGGAGSRDAAALPGRLHWALGLDGATPELRLRHACCLEGELRLHLRPQRDGVALALAPADGAPSAAIASPALSAVPTGPGPAPAAAEGRVLGHWPSAWLAGLGTPWNTLQPSGLMRLSSPGFVLELGRGGARWQGQAALDLEQLAARVSPLPALGSYRLALAGAGDGAAQLLLTTRQGPLLLQGSGLWQRGALRFTGQASAAPGSEAALANLLNLIGRRQGAVSVLQIG
jgi:general secretion pathway protein N